jgi:adenylate kinase
LKENNKINSVILITGTPGVGKTTITHKLASKLGANHIDLNQLVRTENLVTSFDNLRKTWIADTTKVSKRLKQILAKSKKTTIIEGHYAIQVVPRNVLKIVFVLRRDPHELKKTLEERGYSENKVNENVAAEILDVCLCEAISNYKIKKVCEINTSNKPPEKVVEELILKLKKKEQCKTGIVDWLSKLENEGQLEFFLK